MSLDADFEVSKAHIRPVVACHSNGPVTKTWAVQTKTEMPAGELGTC